MLFRFEHKSQCKFQQISKSHKVQKQFSSHCPPPVGNRSSWNVFVNRRKGEQHDRISILIRKHYFWFILEMRLCNWFRHKSNMYTTIWIKKSTLDYNHFKWGSQNIQLNCRFGISQNHKKKFLNFEVFMNEIERRQSLWLAKSFVIIFLVSVSREVWINQ